MQRGFGLHLTTFKTCVEKCCSLATTLWTSADLFESCTLMTADNQRIVFIGRQMIPQEQNGCLSLHQNWDVTVTPSVEIQHAVKIMEGTDRRKAGCCCTARVPHNNEVLGLNLLFSWSFFSLFVFACGLPLTVQRVLVVLACDSKSAAGIDMSVNACVCVLALWPATCPGCTVSWDRLYLPQGPWIGYRSRKQIDWS